MPARFFEQAAQKARLGHVITDNGMFGEQLFADGQRGSRWIAGDGLALQLAEIAGKPAGSCAKIQNSHGFAYLQAGEHNAQMLQQQRTFKKGPKWFGHLRRRIDDGLVIGVGGGAERFDGKGLD